MRGQHQPRIRPHDADRAPWRSPLVAPLLVAAFTTLVFLPSVWCGFVNWDDGEYANNALVLAGLSAESIHDAFTKVFYTDWAPVTRLSFLTDATLFSGAPWGFHLTNVLLHAATAGILCAALAAMTGCPGRSLAATLLFAVHPLRVESVAWISERKDVLSMLFLALALVAYEWYARRPSPARYAAVAAAMLGSLMSKATLVTLPVLLLLLDAWPLERTSPVPDHAATCPRRSWRQLVVEKLPLLALSLVFSVLTVTTQRNAVHDEASMPLVSTRLPNALYAPIRYVGMTIWPVGLHARYPHPGRDAIPVHWWILGVVGCVGLAGLVVACRRRLPAVSVGITWFCVAILPVSGLVKQFGMHSHADRYTYAPHVGLFVAIVWAAWAIVERTAARRWAGPALAAVLAVCVAIDQRLIAAWHDTATLWSRVLEYEPASDTAAEALVQHHAARGDVEGALTIAERIAATHARTTAFMAIAEVQEGSGDFAAAVETCRREAAAKRRHHGPESPATLEAMVRHLTSLRNAGAPEAESLARELEPTLRRVLGLGHISTLRTLVVIAGAANRAGDPSTAERYAREVLEAVGRTVEPVPEIRKPATIALAESLDRQGSTAAAGSLLERAITEHGGLDGDAVVANSQLAVALAAHLARIGRVAEARAFLEPVAARIEAISGVRHPATLSVRRFLGTLASSPGVDP